MAHFKKARWSLNKPGEKEFSSTNDSHQPKEASKRPTGRAQGISNESIGSHPDSYAIWNKFIVVLNCKASYNTLSEEI